MLLCFRGIELQAAELELHGGLSADGAGSLALSGIREDQGEEDQSRNAQQDCGASGARRSEMDHPSPPSPASGFTSVATVRSSSRK